MSSTPLTDHRLVVGDRVQVSTSNIPGDLPPFTLPVGATATVIALSDAIYIDVAWDDHPDLGQTGWDVRRFTKIDVAGEIAAQVERMDATAETAAPSTYQVDITEVYVLVGQTGYPSTTRVNLVGLGNDTWVQTQREQVLEVGTGPIDAAIWERATALSSAQMTTLLANVARRAKGLTEETADLRRQIQGHHQWKDRLVEDAHAYADEHDLCEAFDEFMEEHDLPRREREYEVLVEVTFTTKITVKAHSDEEATELVDERYWSTSDWEHAITDHSDDLDYYQTNVTGWTAQSADPA